MILLWLTAFALASDFWVVRVGDTPEQIAAALDDPALAEAIRRVNDLGPRQTPEVGTILRLPTRDAPHAHQSSAVLTARGEVTAQLPGADPVGVQLGAELPAGTVVCTGASGTATLRLTVSARGGIHDDLRLLPDTCVVIEGLSAQGTRRRSLVAVRRGSVDVRTASSPGSVTIRTAAGVTSGDGGGFRVTVEQDGAARSEALRAAVDVFGAGEQLALEAGFGSRVRPDQRPSAPVRLLAPGTPVHPMDRATLRVPEFRWTEVPNALGYRIEIAASEDFTDLLQVQDVGPTEWLPQRLFLPHRVPGLWWRVASFDRTGFVGDVSPANQLLLPEGIGP